MRYRLIQILWKKKTLHLQLIYVNENCVISMGILIDSTPPEKKRLKKKIKSLSGDLMCVHDLNRPPSLKIKFRKK